MANLTQWGRLLLGGVTVMLAVLAIGGCGSGPELDGEWVLTGAQDTEGILPLLPGEPERLTIDGDRITGGTGCNSFGGEVRFDGDEFGGDLRLIDVSVTERACVEPERMDFERRFTSVFFSIDRYVVTDDVLTLPGLVGELQYQVRVPPEPLPLVDTGWVLDTVFSGSGPSGTASSANAAAPFGLLSIGATDESGLATITFRSKDCGEFVIPLRVGNQEESSGSISTPPNIRLASPQCDDPESNLLAAHAGVLAADRWEIDDNRLTFFSGDNPTVAFRTL